MNEAALVAIAGPIGVGKTTLAKRLARRLAARLILEPYDENPFLQRFYADRDRWALHTQLWYYQRRSQQLSLEGWPESGICVADYIFAKERIFAELNLDAEQLSLYRQLTRICRLQLKRPDVCIYLHQNPQRLLENIRRRARPYECNITFDYLRRISQGYERLLLRRKQQEIADRLLRLEEGKVEAVLYNDATLEELIISIREELADADRPHG